MGHHSACRSRQRKRKQDLFGSCRTTAPLRSLIATLARGSLPRVEESVDVGRHDLLHEVRDFSVSLLKDHLFKKHVVPSKDKANELRNAALSKFFVAEEVCKETNKRFKSMSGGHYGPWTREINLAKNLIWDLISPTVDLQKVSTFFTHGKGASALRPFRARDLAYRYSGIPEVTPGCLPYAMAIMENDDQWKRACFHDRISNDTFYGFKLYPHGKVTTVPKNSSTDRTIGIEPMMNMYVQRGFGLFIRNRLKRVGIDLQDQTANQDLAGRCYDDSYATIDLSMASDTVSTEVVRHLLPPDWFHHLNEVRTTSVVLPSKEIHFLSKFSAMGNGFTFELETLLFWALSESINIIHAGGQHRTLVYGDDIIIHQDLATATIELLSFCGFTTNKDKSFVSGPYFESCGKHFFKGHDVTPFYSRRPSVDVFDVFTLHNQLVLWRDRVEHFLTEADNSAVNLCLTTIKRSIPSYYRKLKVPECLGSSGFIDHSFRGYDVGDQLEGKYFNVLLRVGNRHRVTVPGLLRKSLDRIGSEEAGNIHPIRKTMYVKEKAVFVPTHRLRGGSVNGLTIEEDLAVTLYSEY